MVKLRRLRYGCYEFVAFYACTVLEGLDRDGNLDLTDGDLDVFRDKKSVKELSNQFEVAIGDGMEFTIHGNIL